MSKDELEKIGDAWVAGVLAEVGTPEYENNLWALEKVTQWALDEPEMLWPFVLSTYRREVTAQVLAVLAAGPLEDLLWQCGPDYIDRVEKLAADDAHFNWLLGGVWQNGIAQDVWSRVVAVRRKVW